MPRLLHKNRKEEDGIFEWQRRTVAARPQQRLCSASGWEPASACMRVRSPVKVQFPTCLMRGRCAGFAAYAPHTQTTAAWLPEPTLKGSHSSIGEFAGFGCKTGNSKGLFCLSVESGLNASGHVKNPCGKQVSSVSAPRTSANSFPITENCWGQRPQAKTSNKAQNKVSLLSRVT